jgi:hypothetical protein
MQGQRPCVVNDSDFMKIIKLTRPALDPGRNLEFQAREAQGGLMDFVLSQAVPHGWLEMELVEEDQPATRSLSRRWATPAE